MVQYGHAPIESTHSIYVEAVSALHAQGDAIDPFQTRESASLSPAEHGVHEVAPVAVEKVPIASGTSLYSIKVHV